MSNWFKTQKEEDFFIEAYGRANATFAESDLWALFDEDPDSDGLNLNHECYTSVVDAKVLWDIARKDLQAELELVKAYLETVYEALPDLTSNERVYGTESSVLITDIKEVLGK
jgi:hypothetical protein